MSGKPIEWSVEPPATGLIASGGTNLLETTQLDHPPAAWFTSEPAHKFAYAVEFEADGRVHGYVSQWGLSHIGFLNRSVPTPRSDCGYAKFLTGAVLADDGTRFATGRLTIDTVHPKFSHVAQNETSAFYDHTGCAVADVTVSEDSVGIFVCGAIRPDVTGSQMRVVRGSDWSPDWRSFNHNLEMVAVLGCNLSGFVVDGLVASGGLTEDQSYVMPGEFSVEFNAETGDIESMFGAPIKPVNAVEARLAALEAWVGDKMEVERLEAQDAKMARARELTERFSINYEVNK